MADRGVETQGAGEPRPVSAWRDQSGHSHDAVELDPAKQPQYFSSTPLAGIGAATMPWVSFTPGTGAGTSDGSELDLDLTFLAGSSYTIIAAVSRFGDKWENYFVGSGHGNWTHDALHVGFEHTANFRFSQFGNDLDAPVTANGAMSWQGSLSTARLDRDGGRAVYVDGVLLRQDGWTTPLASGARGVVGRGYETDPDNTFFDGAILELLIFDSALSDDDRQSVESYLRAKWQLP
jgi:hypothetical protein